jgi:hypothetical protein
MKRESEAPSIRTTRFHSVGYGHADLYTFTLDEAARFAKGKIEALTTLERSIDTKTADNAGPLKITPLAVLNSGRRRKRA